MIGLAIRASRLHEDGSNESDLRKSLLDRVSAIRRELLDRLQRGKR